MVRLQFLVILEGGGSLLRACFRLFPATFPENSFSDDARTICLVIAGYAGSGGWEHRGLVPGSG